MRTAQKPGLMSRINALPSGQRMAVFGVVGLVAFMVIGTIMTGNDGAQKSPDKTNNQVDFRPMVGADGNNEQLQAQISSTGESLTQQQNRIAQLEAQLENANKNQAPQGNADNWSDMQVLVGQLQELRQEINSMKANGTSAAASIGALPEVDLSAALPVAGSSSSPQMPSKGAIPVPTPVQAEQPRIQVVGSRPSAEAQAALAKKTKPVAYLPAGSVFEGVLLTGMDASTAVAANKTPTPALFRVKTDAILPNLYTQDVRECFVLAGGFGNLSSERAEMRTQTISCVNENGEVFEGDIEGYLVGEDGKAGVRGRVVSKQGSILANSLMAGFVGGLGAAFSPQQVNSLNLDGGNTQSYQVPSAEYILGSSVGRGLNQSGQALSQFYISMAQQMFPVIEIDAMRKVSIVLIKGIELRKQEKKV